MTESVVWPLAPSAAIELSGRREVDGIEGKRIAFLWDDLFQGDKMFDAFVEAAAERGEAFEAVPWTAFGDIHGPDERRIIADLPRLLEEHGVDAAVVGVGACGSCTPAVIRACQAVETAGIPALALISSGFMRQAQATARAVKLEHLWIAEYPGVIPVDSPEEFDTKVRTHVVPSLFEGFEKLRAGFEVVSTATSAEPSIHDVVFTGTFDEIQDEFADRQWSDGLPIVPPTVSRVEEFLRYTDRRPDEVVGTMLPAMRDVTIWSIAVNGVMAGCRPEYMPVLIAVAEVMADPRWRLEDGGATPGWEPLILVSGPITKLLDMNDGAGMMRVGRRSNSTLGRFGRLIMRNLAGFLTPPGDTDKGAIGRTFNVAMAENDEATVAVGWHPTRVEAGFDIEDSVVSVQSVVGISGPAYTGGEVADQLEVLVRYAEDTLGPWSFTNILYRESSTLLLMSPSVARSFAEAGFSKWQIQEHLSQHVRIPAGVLEAEARMGRGNDFSFAELVARGTIPAEFAESDDPARLLRVIEKPEFVRIVVAGDGGRNQNRFYWNNHEQGMPSYPRKVEMNAAMRALSDAAKAAR